MRKVSMSFVAFLAIKEKHSNWMNYSCCMMCKAYPKYALFPMTFWVGRCLVSGPRNLVRLKITEERVGQNYRASSFWDLKFLSALQTQLGGREFTACVYLHVSLLFFQQGKEFEEAAKPNRLFNSLKMVW